MEGIVLRALNVGIIPLCLLVLGWFTKKYIVPFLQTETRRAVARYVLLLADEITDWLMVKYPRKKWTEWLDEAIDKLIDVTGVSPNVAERAIKASISRKNGQ